MIILVQYLSLHGFLFLDFASLGFIFLPEYLIDREEEALFLDQLGVIGNNFDTQVSSVIIT